MERYDVIIVGTGPAGIFAAWELISSGKKARICMLDKGGSLAERVEETRTGVQKVKTERPDVLSCGWGGAGAFSDGKLNLPSEVGGFLKDYLKGAELSSLIGYVDGIYLRFGAPQELHGTDIQQIKDLEDAAVRHGLRFIPFPIRHLGSDRCASVLGEFLSHMEKRVTLRFHDEAVEILYHAGKAVGVKTGSGEEIAGDFVVIAPGRGGAQWLEKESRRLGLTTLTNPGDIGGRVEGPAPGMEPSTDIGHEGKPGFYSKQFDDPGRTFCMNPYGEVVREYHGDLCLVNGHSYSMKRSNNTNFAILVSTVFTKPFSDPIAYGRYIAR